MPERCTVDTGGCRACGHDTDEHESGLCYRCDQIESMEGKMHVPASPMHPYDGACGEPAVCETCGDAMHDHEGFCQACIAEGEAAGVEKWIYEAAAGHTGVSSGRCAEHREQEAG